MPRKLRLQAPHNHVDLIPLKWLVNDLWNIFPSVENE